MTAALVVPETLDWAKGDGLVPAIVQHWQTGCVLMLGYMNREALEATQAGGRVTFYSRRKQRLWEKGERSGNTLELKDMHTDCDADTLLVLAEPHGPTCHLGISSCFGEATAPEGAWLSRLDALIDARDRKRPEGSYTTRLLQAGVRRIAQKVGEEGVETALAGVAQDNKELANETADLFYHVLVLLRARGLGLSAVLDVLRQRHAG